MYGFIYITTNKVNGKRYVGACNYSRPNWPKYLGSGKFLRKAIKKYGSGSFKREIILETETHQELVDAEIRIIKERNAVEDRNWYNIAPGGYVTNGFLGKKHTFESNERRAAKLRGVPRPPHVGEAVGNARRGKKNPQWAALMKSKVGEKSPKARAVTIYGIEYPTITAATMATGFHHSKILKLAGLKPIYSVKRKVTDGVA